MQPLNVLLITTSQQRADTLGAYGNPICRTPNLDALAEDGELFLSCRTQSPTSQPSRATLLTGRHPSGHGVVSAGVDLPDDAAGESVATLLGAAGLSTAIFGKAHFASAFPHFPTGRPESVEGSAHVAEGWRGPYFGFDHAELVVYGHNLRLAPQMGRWNWCFGPPPFGLHYARWLHRDGAAFGRERLRLMQPEAAGVDWTPTQAWRSALAEEDNPNTWVADRAVEWLAAAKAPFFAWVSFPGPHHPFDPPARWHDMYGPGDLRDLLPARQRGELEGKPPVQKAWSEGLPGLEGLNPGGANLNDLQLATMTAAYYAVVSQLDHHVGRLMEVLKRRRLLQRTLVVFCSDLGTLLGEHGQVFSGPLHYDELLRVPLIARGPGYSGGRSIAHPVGLVDVAPSLLEAAGVAAPAGMEGRPLHQPHDHVLSEGQYPLAGGATLRTVSTERHKLTRYEGRQGVGELYDLAADPGELHNLWAEPASWKLRAELMGLLDSGQSRTVRQLPAVSRIG